MRTRELYLYQLNGAVNASGASPIIRVPNAEEWMIKRALDAGAHGIMTPMCHTAVSWSFSPYTSIDSCFRP